MIRSMFFTSVLLLSLAIGAPAGALPSVGVLRPAARVVDADDKSLDLRAINGRPILIVYEDKESSKLNVPLKEDLSRLARGDRYKSAIALVPVADVEGYDYWPVRGFVKDAIRDESKKIGATIFCDWDGSFRRAVGLRRGTSSVVLVGRDARVLFASEGALSRPERQRLLELLRTEVEAAGTSSDALTSPSLRPSATTTRGTST